MIIPKIESKAYYVYLGDLMHTYDGMNFFFDFEDDLPNDLQISSSIFDKVILAELSFDSLRIADQGKIISSLSNFTADVYSLLYNASLQGLYWSENLFVDESTNYALKWTVTYNGIVGTDRYSWTFNCPLGSQTLILGSDGLLPHPSDHTYTSHGDFDIVGDQDDDQFVYIPNNSTQPLYGLKTPYFSGKQLHFFIVDTSWGESHVVLDDFTNTFIECRNGSGKQLDIMFSSPSHSLSGSIVSFTGVSGNFRFGDPNTSSPYSYTSPYYSGSNLTVNTIHLVENNSSHVSNFILPCKNVSNNSYPPPTYSVSLPYSSLGWYENTSISGSSNFYLKAVEYDPVDNPDDIVLPPADVPVPADPIITWPDDNLPDEDPDGEPTVVDPYIPVEPIVPLPPIPSVVSGNDDLWPDLNDYFETEDNIIDFTFPAVNVEFPDLSILLGNFVNSFTWVSTIITALFNGSEFSVLFSVLAFFFIAAAVLGIYKWWK